MCNGGELEKTNIYLVFVLWRMPGGLFCEYGYCPGLFFLKAVKKTFKRYYSITSKGHRDTWAHLLTTSQFQITTAWTGARLPTTNTPQLGANEVFFIDCASIRRKGNSSSGG